MKFLDEAKIFIQSGDGGAGSVSFRREKNIPRGGPDGGDGQRGGAIIFTATNSVNTLIDFRYTQHFKASKGGHGMGRLKSGRSADDIVIRLPIGTQIIESNTNEVLADMLEEGQTYTALIGGEGGRGNASFKSSTMQAPKFAGDGFPGEEKWVWLKLKLIADVGFLGYPNAGKSTFISSVSNARPKIADYPFTTLQPHLGMVRFHETDMVLADLPGLIEGASEGVGLGHKFLKHLSRCAVMLHLIDATAEKEEIADAYYTLREELLSYDEDLANKSEVIALTKIDAITPEDLAEKMEWVEEEIERKVLAISSVSKLNLNDVLTELEKVVSRTRAERIALEAKLKREPKPVKQEQEIDVNNIENLVEEVEVEEVPDWEL